MSNGGSRVSIPSGVRKTIQNIKEITDKHSDEDIYAVLKECSMDPNETIQKLLYLDAFHEVKRKHDRKKENLNIRSYEDSRPVSAMQGRVARGGRGNYYSHNLSHDTNGGRNVAPRKENRVNHNTGRGSLPVFHKTENKGTPIMTKSLAVEVNGPSKVSNGGSIQDHGSQASTGVENLHRDSLAVDANKLGTAPPQLSPDGKQHLSSTPTPTVTYASCIRAEQRKPTSLSNHHAVSAAASGVSSSASEPVLVPSLNSRLPGLVGAIVVTQQVATESSRTAIAEINHKMNNHVPENVDDSDSICKKAASGTADSLDKKMPNQSMAADETQLSTSDDSQLLQQHTGPSEVVTSGSASITVEASSQSLPDFSTSVLEEETTKLHLSNTQHVIFPNHFQVPEEFKSGLTFGSFEVSLGLNSKYINGIGGEKTSSQAVDSFQANDETAWEPSLNNQSASSTAQEVDYPDHLQFPENVPENTPSEGDDSSNAPPKFDQSKHETLLPLGGGPPFPVQNAHNYNFGFVPPMVGSQPVQFEGSEPQAGIPNFANGNSLVQSTSGPTPPATQPAAGTQSSVLVSPQQVPIFRQAYPPNYLPYSHYISPYFVPPIHQFLSHGGFPQQPSSGNFYLPPSAASTGIKYSLPQYKPGTNMGNQTHVGIPSGYGSFTPSPVAYGLSTAATSGGSTGNEDFAASHLKENNAYTTGQQTEGSAVWIPAAGRDIPGLPANSFYNLPPHGQHVAFSPAHAGHGAFAGLYHPAQTMTMTAPSTVHPLLQQSQNLAGSADTVGPPPPSGSYQQHQGSHMNWSASY